MNLDQAEIDWRCGTDERSREPAGVVSKNDRMLHGRTPHFRVARDASGYPATIPPNMTFTGVDPSVALGSKPLGQVDLTGLAWVQPIAEDTPARARIRRECEAGVLRQ